MTNNTGPLRAVVHPESTSVRSSTAPATNRAMTKHPLRNWLITLGFVFASALTACQSPIREATFGASLSGVDHLANYLSVSDFSVNGTGGFQAGTGASTVCCVSLPDKWHPGLTAHVTWNVSNWKDNARSGSYEADVPVDQYAKHGQVWVHFLENGTVRVVVSDYYPRSPDYPGPHDPIPQKEPWYRYPARGDSRELAERYLDYDIAEKQCAETADPKACEINANEKSLDEQLVDARRYLPPCASVTDEVVECARAAEERMRAARWARRCKAKPDLAECADK